MCLAIPGLILSVDEGDPLLRRGRVSFGGIIKEVSLACTPEARIDDYVLVHVGLAISVIDPTEATRILQTLQDLDELAELEQDPP